MTDPELFFLDQSGLIPGPEETPTRFTARAAEAKKKFEEGSWISPAHWEFSRELLTKLFHVKPLYICAFYGNQRLMPWEGAAAWIENDQLHSIQLREKLAQGSYLGLYNREEVLAHEAVHAARAAFAKDRFEEFFAYMTSERRWRQALGPILRRPWEVWPLLGALLYSLFSPLGYLAVSVWLGLGFVRLIRGHLTLNQAYRQILREAGDADLSRALLFRLDQPEIEGLARGRSFSSYLTQGEGLRWKVIGNLYSYRKTC